MDVGRLNPLGWKHAFCSAGGILRIISGILPCSLGLIVFHTSGWFESRGNNSNQRLQEHARKLGGRVATTVVQRDKGDLRPSRDQSNLRFVTV